VILKDDETSEHWRDQIHRLSDESQTIIKHQKNAKVVEKLTRRILLKRDDWDDWKQSEARQLNQY